MVMLGVVAFYGVILPLILRLVLGGTWRPLWAAHPGVAPAEGAVRRGFQSYKLGIVNLGFMIHTEVDERYLHLQPALFGRLCGMRRVSAPWEAVEPVKRIGKRYAEVRIAGQRLFGPAWALGLAFGDAGEKPGSGGGTRA